MRALFIFQKYLKFKKGKKFFFGIHRSAIYEIFLMIFIILFLANMFGNEDRFMEVWPHPFWIIILLISTQYGTNEGIISVIICTIMLYAFNVPEHKISETIYDYITRLTIRPFMWVGTSVIIGELINRHVIEKFTQKERMQIMEKEVESITNAYKRLKLLKEALETRLAGELSSSITIYEAAKSLESLSQTKILLNIENVILSTMSPKKFSVYSSGPNGFEPATSHGWEEDDHYVLRFPKDTNLYKEIVAKKRVFCIINKDDERILSPEGVIAGPLIDETSGEIFGMLKIEELGFMELTMRNIETFRILCEWIGMAYSHAGEYQAVKSESLMSEDHRIYSANFYKNQSNYLKLMSEYCEFNLGEIRIRVKQAKTIEGENYNLIRSKLEDIFEEVLSEIDEAFDERKLGMGFKIIMPNKCLGLLDKEVVRIKSLLDKWLQAQDFSAEIEYETTMIHEKHEGQERQNKIKSKEDKS